MSNILSTMSSLKLSRLYSRILPVTLNILSLVHETDGTLNNDLARILSFWISYSPFLPLT